MPSDFAHHPPAKTVHPMAWRTWSGAWQPRGYARKPSNSGSIQVDPASGQLGDPELLCEGPYLALAAEADPAGTGVPVWVERDFRAYLRCGILAHGFARARCADCRHEFLVAFSCKGRGVCPSCNARRMVETAAHLTDNVLPALPVRQWVLSVPKRLRPFPASQSGHRQRGAPHLPTSHPLHTPPDQPGRGSRGPEPFRSFTGSGRRSTPTFTSTSAS